MVISTFHPQDPDSWADHVQYLKTRHRPDPDAPLEDLLSWNLNIGPLRTDDTVRVARAISQAQRRNRHAPLTGRSIVVVDGPPMAGKTYAVLSAALEQTAQALEGPSPDPLCHRPRPWVYVELLNHTGAKSIAQALARSVGALVERSATTPQYVAAIRHMAPKVGLRGYIIDDAHGMLGARNRNNSSMATALKGLITGIPATAVVTGANLRRDGIFQGTAGEQVRLSAHTWVECGDWGLPSRGATTGWERLVRQLRSHMVLPGGERQFALATTKTVRLLAEGSMGRPGLAIKWATEAATYAVLQGQALDAEALTATSQVVDPAQPDSGGGKS